MYLQKKRFVIIIRARPSLCRSATQSSVLSSAGIHSSSGSSSFPTRSVTADRKPEVVDDRSASSTLLARSAGSAVIP